MRSNNVKSLNLTYKAARRSLTTYGTGGGLRSRGTALLEEMDIDLTAIDSTMLL